DLPQSGYLPNHKLNPTTVGSSGFQTLWTFTSPDPRELWLAKPLVYTPEGGAELLITSSEKNNIRVFDSKTGTILNQRALQTPFATADAKCEDIPGSIGVTGTPIIDPRAGIMYLFSKGYRDGTNEGLENAVYKLYALRIPTLEDVAGFPVLIDGTNADNDPARYFVAGVALQRPSLTEINGHIVGAFGSHCGHWNYTGYLVSVSKTPGVGVVSMFATESQPGAPKPQPLDLATEKGGKAGIWQSGMGLPTIGNRVYFVTGNGQGHANGNIPASGRLPMSTLDETVAAMEISTDGKIRLADYFQPYEYISLDAGDRDLGSSGLCVLDGSVFKGTGANRMAVVAGKTGKVFVLNVDNLGGFRQGPGGVDATMQTFYVPEKRAVYGGFGSYPLEGGYIYVSTINGNALAYKLGHDANGVPSFSLAGASDFIIAGRVGVGQMTVTSDNNKPGTGILWVTDVNYGLAAFRAVPEDGKLVQITLPKIQGANKYQRPVFGDGRVFVQSNSNKLFALGTSVASALTCADPIDFGYVVFGSSITATVTCKANTAITAIDEASVSDPSFLVSKSSIPKGVLAAGASFTFDVTWNLTSSAADMVPGLLTGSLTLSFNAAADYASNAVVSLEGTAISEGPYLHASPSEVLFGRLILGAGETSDGLTTTAMVHNSGNDTLTFTGLAWEDDSGSFMNITAAGDLGSSFSSTAFPLIGSILQPGESRSVRLNFNGKALGSYSTRVKIWSNGGSATINLTASVNSPPTAAFEVSYGAGGWSPLLPSFKVQFGDVFAGASVETRIRLCNNGGSPLTITISKPPTTAQLLATNPNHELTEGQKIDAASCATGTIAVLAAPQQPNHPSQYLSAQWTISTDGLSSTTGEASGRHTIDFDATVRSAQVGPLLDDGTARYQWVGCFADTTSLGRNLENSANNNAQQLTNTLQQCQGLCLDRGYILSGVQYHKECWCGTAVKNPSTYKAESLNLCTYDCTGDSTQACGGDGGHMSLYADVTKFDIESFLASANVSRPTTTSSSVTTASTTAASVVAVTTDGSAASSIQSSTSASSILIPATPLSTTASTNSSTASVSASSTTSNAAAPNTSSASSLNPNQPALVAGRWNYTGCFKDNVNNVRTFRAANIASDDMTPDACAVFCGAGAWNGGGYNFFGLEYSRECFCGWTAPDAVLTALETECANTCSGLTLGTLGRCGGGSRLSVFQNTLPNGPPPPVAHVAQAGKYFWVGCNTEATTGRALSAKTYASDDMTLESCATFCSESAYAYMGVEYGRECYCGTSLGAGSVLAPSAECNLLCKGNQFQYCGAGGRIDLYQLAPAASSSTPSSAPTFQSLSASAIDPVTSSESSLAMPTSTSSSSAVVASTLLTTSSSTSPSPSPTSTSLSTTSSSISSSPTSSRSSSLSTATSDSSSLSMTTANTPTRSSTLTVPTVEATTTSPITTLMVRTSNSQTSTGPTATATDGYYYIGCFSDVKSGHALPHIFSNSSVTPELAIAHVNSVAVSPPSPSPRPRLLFLEYHHEIYGGANFDFQGGAVTSLVGSRACRDYCYGSVSTVTATDSAAVATTTGTANYCGGPGMFDLYALETTELFPATGGEVVTATAM
ncbi:hypothetical protein B0T22DRAFT_387291, partial [Podospora appendiculata]